MEKSAQQDPVLKRLPLCFYTRDAKTVAIELLGKTIVRRHSDGEIVKYIITETEAYLGEFDLACHASKGKTPRTEIMFTQGGVLYIYLIYGMYWMMNIVTGFENQAQAVLIRGIDKASGPGKTAALLQLSKEFNGESLLESNRIWLEDSNLVCRYKATPRIGVDYAGEFWKSQLLRFCAIV
ncbi:MAG: DNA-3-methyladenine glycosylase [Bacteroidales bacterium]|nr:DNA-3-methyladenine glycosylase [Bacteroidales bacterium]HOY38160.1 DNA-3-methyladenine glycosylase [Bacteroidales bacterium]HQP03058.1 DNA-3-methyladenine glycosylase [Bacteroidales bacterium]